MDLNELIQKLGEHPKDQVVTALKSGAHPVFQEVFNAGHSTATEQAKTDKQALETQLADVKADLDKATTRVQELEEKAPDVAKVREQYQTEITDLKTKHEQELEDRDQRLRNERMGRAVSDLRTKLVERGVDGEYAQVKVERADVRARLRHNDDGQLEVLQAGKEIPFQPADGKNALDLLADEIREGTDPKWITSNADRGSGTGGGGGRPGGDMFDRIRKETKEREKAQGARSPEERLGLSRTA